MSASIVSLEGISTESEAVAHKIRLELSALRRIGVHSVKILHSSTDQETERELGQACRQLLNNMLAEKKIRAFCPGEFFGPFEKEGQSMARFDSCLRQDPDWARHNHHITMVAL
ncbi:MAG: hypothetical protein PHP39_06200 [Oscillospiraceae bacterium]|nr:hypothetical protein [Oscillospiraceae bacterium]